MALCVAVYVFTCYHVTKPSSGCHIILFMLKFSRRPTQHCMALSWDWIDNSPTHNLIAKGRGERRVLDGSGKRRVKQLFMMLKKRCQTESYHEWGASHEDCFPQIITQGCYEPFKIMSLCGISYLTSNSSSYPPGHFSCMPKRPFCHL